LIANRRTARATAPDRREISRSVDRSYKTQPVPPL
jgi:hypothetical protein